MLFLNIDTIENAMPDPTQATHDTAGKPVKKSYEPPRILSREYIEAVATTGCGKNAASCFSGGTTGYVNS